MTHIHNLLRLTLSVWGSTLDVRLRQILTSKVDRRAERVNIFIMAVGRAD